MAVKQYQAAGGVVIQKGLIDGLDPLCAYVLLLDRPDRAEVRLPKGHIDPGEDAQTAALRETVEESGYADVTILADLGNNRVEFEYKGNQIIRDEHYFLMELASPLQVERPAQDARQFQPLWIELEHATEMLTFDAEKSVVRDALAVYLRRPV